MERNIKDRPTSAINRIRKNVEHSWEYYRNNNERFNFFKKFVFLTSMSDDDITLLKALKKPQIEFNVCEAYISRLLGEWSKQEPSIKVSTEDGQQIDPMMLQIVEGHIRHILFAANKNGCEYEVYRDQLAGGFSAYKVTTDYAHPMSFDQIIKLDRVYDPTLCGFDTLAKHPTKSDGQYSFELYPLSKQDFKEQYPEIELSTFHFTRNVEGFNWTYQNNQEDIVLVCDYYEKKKKRVKIVKLASGHVMPLRDYEKFIEQWNAAGNIAQPPAIVGKPRVTDVTTIMRYVFTQDVLLKEEKTNYKYLPHVYVPGNDIMIRQSVGGAATQTTRPYVYHAKGIQQLKNFAGQTLANEIENMIMHKWVAAKEGIPQEEDYLQAYTDPQTASILVYNAFNENAPEQGVPPPREVQRVPTPPEVTNAFAMSDQVMQSILGSYDASLGINDNQLSGVAIVEGASQSNAAAMPYIVSHLEALTQVANIFVDLIPKYYVTPRTIPVTGLDGQNHFVRINQRDNLPQGQKPIFVNYDENALNVKVEAGVNFSIQKSRALQQIVALMQASPLFAQFMNTEGLPVLLDNIEIRGIDQLRLLAQGWMQQMKKMQQQSAQMPNPEAMKAQVAQAKIQEGQQKLMFEEKKHQDQMAQDREDNLIEIMKLHADTAKNKRELHLKEKEIHSDHSLRAHDMRHSHSIEVVRELLHEAEIKLKHLREQENVHRKNEEGKKE